MNLSQPPIGEGGSQSGSRRAFLGACAALVCAPAWARSTSSRLAAAWRTDAGHQVGILEAGESLRITAALDVPTRAHALLLEPEGSLLAVARRPGDWLLRFSPAGRPLAWRWIEPGRAFTGHALRDGAHLYIAETDLETGQGLIGVRDAATLEKRAEWPSYGMDPHQLVWDPAHPGALMVANGGIPTRPETGRRKVDRERMDSSLVRLDARTGARLGQWRLADPRLSLRHLAWHDATLGVALQAEHDDPALRSDAPVLALFEGERLRSVPPPRSLAGYGGDIAATAEGFAVSCPRAQGVAGFSPQGDWRSFMPLDEACALAGPYWGGRQAARIGERVVDLPGLRLDNHWVLIA